MRVLHLYSGNLFGGIETILLSLARHGVANGVAHEFALCFDARLAAELRSAGAAVHLLAPVRVSRPRTIRQARRRLAALLASRDVGVCIAHAPWSQALFASTVRRAGVPLAFWAHDVWSGRHWTERWARRTPPDLVLANSVFTLRTLNDVFPRVPRDVVYAPIDVERAALPDAERTAIRAELSTSDTAVVILQASRLEAWKGHETLLRALAALDRQSPWICWIAGGAQRAAERAYEQTLHTLACRLGIADRLRFVGERRDVARLLAAADVYCQPNSAPEPFGVVFVEALAAGLPVVTSGIGGAVEIVDESCGRLVAPRDASDWRAALSSLVERADLRAQLGAAGPRRAASLCEPARQLERLHTALRSVVRVPVAG